MLESLEHYQDDIEGRDDSPPSPPYARSQSTRRSLPLAWAPDRLDGNRFPSFLPQQKTAHQNEDREKSWLWRVFACPFALSILIGRCRLATIGSDSAFPASGESEPFAKGSLRMPTAIRPRSYRESLQSLHLSRMAKCPTHCEAICPRDY